MGFVGRVPFKEFKYLEKYPFFRRGLSRKVNNLITVRDTYRNLDLDIFDFSYSSGKNRFRNSILVINSKQLDLPNFSMSPEHLGQKIAEVFGQQDIDFPLFPRFSKNYFVRGISEGDIRYMMHDRFVEFFNNRPGWTLHGGGKEMVLYKKRKRFKPKDIKGFHEFGLRVHELLTERTGSGFV